MVYLKFMGFLEYEFIDLAQSLEYLRFRNVRLPQSLCLACSLHKDTWDFAEFYFGYTTDNLLVFSGGHVERLTVQRPNVIKTILDFDGDDDPIEDFD